MAVVPRERAPSVNLRNLDILWGLLAVYGLAGHARWLLWAEHAEWVGRARPWWADGNLLLGIDVVVSFATVRTRFASTVIVGVLKPLGIRSRNICICHSPPLVLLSAWIIDRTGRRPLLAGWLAFVEGVATLRGKVGLFDVCERHFLHPRLRPGSVRASGSAGASR